MALPHSAGMRAARALCLSFGLAAVAAAGNLPLPSTTPPILLRLSGQFVDGREAARKRGLEGVTLGFGSSTRWLGVLTARTFGGDRAVNGRDVLAAVRPLQPNLLVVGPPDLRAQLEQAPAGVPVEMEGAVATGPRTFLLRNVTVHLPPTTAP
jgi:hypothetical protein